MSELLMEVKDLKTIFKTDEGIVKAVNGVSFTLDKKESLGLVGESGCGKSVTNLSILGLIPQPPGKVISGEVYFNGREILNIPNSEKRHIRGKDITMIFQDPMTSLNPYLSIATQLTEGYIEHEKVSKNEAIDRAIEMLQLVGIPNPAKRIYAYPHQFSGGMRQRVMIAMALMTNPKLLIADEPTTALDVTIQAQILELLKDLKNRLNMSIILITHDLGVVAGMTDRIAVMYAGYIVEENKTAKLFESARHPYTLGLLKSIPHIEKSDKSTLFSIPGSPPNLVGLPDACPFYPRCARVLDECKKKMPPLRTEKDGSRLACYNPY